MPKDKKRKRSNNNDSTNGGSSSTATTTTTTTTTMTPSPSQPRPDIDTTKPSALFHPHASGRQWTLSIALPGSIISNAKSHDQKTLLAGQIARAAAVFCVDEIVVFDDTDDPATASPEAPDLSTVAYTAVSHPGHFLAHLLSYLETPPFLRRALFGMQANLRTAGTLPSLDMPHHMRAGEARGGYREGLVTRHAEGETGQEGGGSYVDVGLKEERFVAGETLPLSARVTVKLGVGREREEGGGLAEVVPPEEPRVVTGYYWGYTVRQCAGLSTVLTECPFDGGYDLSVGTSERGTPLAEAFAGGGGGGGVSEFNHLLLVFGGVAGLEVAAVRDPELTAKGIGKGNVGELFDYWVNVLPGQGSRTIRTEEAVWLGLMGTRVLVENR